MAEQSINIRFVTEEVKAGEALVVELDAEMNEDKVEFLYGEKAYFRVYTFPEDMELTITPSDGAITAEGSDESEEEEDIAFINTSEASCPKPVSSIVSSKWLGTSLGAVSAAGTVINASSEGVAVLKLNYTAKFRRYALSLSAKEEDEYAVVVYIQGGETE
jgi:hypothetical protein